MVHNQISRNKGGRGEGAGGDQSVKMKGFFKNMLMSPRNVTRYKK